MKHNLQYYAIIIAALYCLVGCDHSTEVYNKDKELMDKKDSLYSSSQRYNDSLLKVWKGEAWSALDLASQFRKQRDSLQTILNKGK